MDVEVTLLGQPSVSRGGETGQCLPRGARHGPCWPTSPWPNGPPRQRLAGLLCEAESLVVHVIKASKE